MIYCFRRLRRGRVLIGIFIIAILIIALRPLTWRPNMDSSDDYNVQIVGSGVTMIRNSVRENEHVHTDSGVVYEQVVREVYNFYFDRSLTVEIFRTLQEHSDDVQYLSTPLSTTPTREQLPHSSSKAYTSFLRLLALLHDNAPQGSLASQNPTYPRAPLLIRVAAALDIDVASISPSSLLDPTPPARTRVSERGEVLQRYVSDVSTAWKGLQGHPVAHIHAVSACVRPSFCTMPPYVEPLANTTTGDGGKRKVADGPAMALVTATTRCTIDGTEGVGAVGGVVVRKGGEVLTVGTEDDVDDDGGDDSAADGPGRLGEDAGGSPTEGSLATTQRRRGRASGGTARADTSGQLCDCHTAATAARAAGGVCDALCSGGYDGADGLAAAAATIGAAAMARADGGAGHDGRHSDLAARACSAAGKRQSSSRIPRQSIALPGGAAAAAAVGVLRAALALHGIPLGTARAASDGAQTGAERQGGLGGTAGDAGSRPGDALRLPHTSQTPATVGGTARRILRAALSLLPRGSEVRPLGAPVGAAWREGAGYGYPQVDADAQHDSSSSVGAGRDAAGGDAAAAGGGDDALAEADALTTASVGLHVPPPRPPPTAIVAFSLGWGRRLQPGKAACGKMCHFPGYIEAGQSNVGLAAAIGRAVLALGVAHAGAAAAAASAAAAAEASNGSDSSGRPPSRAPPPPQPTLLPLAPAAASVCSGWGGRGGSTLRAPLAKDAASAGARAEPPPRAEPPHGMAREATRKAMAAALVALGTGGGHPARPRGGDTTSADAGGASGAEGSELPAHGKTHPHPLLSDVFVYAQWEVADALLGWRYPARGWALAPGATRDGNHSVMLELRLRAWEATVGTLAAMRAVGARCTRTQPDERARVGGGDKRDTDAESAAATGREHHCVIPFAPIAGRLGAAVGRRDPDPGSYLSTYGVADGAAEWIRRLPSRVQRVAVVCHPEHRGRCRRIMQRSIQQARLGWEVEVVVLPDAVAMSSEFVDDLFHSVTAAADRAADASAGDDSGPAVTARGTAPVVGSLPFLRAMPTAISPTIPNGVRRLCTAHVPHVDAEHVLAVDAAVATTNAAVWSAHAEGYLSFAAATMASEQVRVVREGLMATHPLPCVVRWRRGGSSGNLLGNRSAAAAGEPWSVHGRWQGVCGSVLSHVPTPAALRGGWSDKSVGVCCAESFLLYDATEWAAQHGTDEDGYDPRGTQQWALGKGVFLPSEVRWRVHEVRV